MTRPDYRGASPASVRPGRDERALQGAELSGLDNVFHDLLFTSVESKMPSEARNIHGGYRHQPDYLKTRMEPLLKVLNRVIETAVTALENVLGIGTGGGGVLGTGVGAAGELQPRFGQPRP